MKLKRNIKSPTDEQRFIKGIVDGNTKIIKEIYNLYGGRVGHYVLKNGGLVQDAQDIFQDAMMIIYDKGQQTDFTLTVQFYTYFFAICKQLWWRKRKKKSYSEITIEDFKGYNLVEESFEKAIIQNEKQELYQQCFLKISAICRKILELSAAEEPMSAIAKTMGFKSEGYARIRKMRCKKKLVEIIKNDKRFNDFYGS